MQWKNQACGSTIQWRQHSMEPRARRAGWARRPQPASVPSEGLPVKPRAWLVHAVCEQLSGLHTNSSLSASWGHQGDGVWRESIWEAIWSWGWDPPGWNEGLYERDPREIAHPCALWGHREKTAVHQPPALSWSWSSQPPKLKSKGVLLISHLLQYHM